MTTAIAALDHLLVPLSAELPAGVDMCLSSEWKSIEKARRSDDELNQGAWQAERKTANWSQVLAQSSNLLLTKSKDLRLAMFWAEAKVRTEGFKGLPDCLRFTRELLNAFWATGLHPLPEILDDGKQNLADRAKALAWMNDKFAEVVSSLPITFASAPASNYSHAAYLSARRVGREKDYEQATSERQESFAAAKREGRCLDLYEEAVKASPRAFYEELSTQLQAAVGELKELEEVVEQKFQSSEDAPGFSEARTTLTDIYQLVGIALREKGPRASLAATPLAKVVATPIASSASAELQTEGSGRTVVPVSTDIGAAWEEAQALVSAGQVDRGLARMGELAQRETSGRNRFQRKLLLAEICMKSRPRLARAILEELAEQIEKYKLEEWETTDVVGGVWTRLYRIYAKSSETEKASELYGRLCRLDPWQTLSCSED